MRLWPCRGVLTAAAQSIAKNGPKMTRKWPFLTLKNAFFQFFAEDSHRSRKVQIANVRSRKYDRLILSSYSRFSIFKNFDKFFTSFSTKWPFLSRISNFVVENIHQISSYIGQPCSELNLALVVRLTPAQLQLVLVKPFIRSSSRLTSQKLYVTITG